MHIALHWRVFSRRLQVLTDGQKIDVRRPEIVHHLQDFLACLTKTDHDAGLCEDPLIDFLGALQETQRMEVARAGPDSQVEAWNRFEIVVEHVRARRNDLFERAILAQKIGCQDLDRRHWRRRANSADRFGEVASAAVVEVVTIDRRHDDMLESQLRDGAGDAFRLAGIERPGQSRRNVAKSAGARADAAHDHHGGVPLLPAFAYVRACRFFADGVKTMLADDVARLNVAGRAGGAHAQPVGLRQHRRVFTRCLFGMAERRYRIICIEKGDHNRLG